MQLSITFQHLGMKVGVNLYGITFHQLTGCLVVSFALDALHLGQQTGNEGAQAFVVSNLDEGLSVTVHDADDVTLCIAPMGDEGTVAHVGLLYLVTRFYARQLRHQTVHHVCIILGLVGLEVGRQPQFHKLWVGHVIKSEEVGTRFFDGVAIGLQRLWVCARQELSATVSEALMQIGMQVVAHIAVLTDKGKGFLVDDKFLLEAAATSSTVIGLRKVANGHALRAVLRTYPVGIGQVNTNGRRGIFVTSEHRRTNNVGRHALYLGFTETRVNRRMVFEPLGVLTDGLRALRGFQVLVLHKSFPRAFQSEGVAIDLNETVDKIDLSVQLTHPLYRISIEHAGVARLVIAHKQADDLALLLVLADFLRLTQPIDDVRYCFPIAATNAPDVLLYPTLALDESGVEGVKLSVER